MKLTPKFVEDTIGFAILTALLLFIGWQFSPYIAWKREVIRIDCAYTDVQQYVQDGQPQKAGAALCLQWNQDGSLREAQYGCSLSVERPEDSPWNVVLCNKVTNRITLLLNGPGIDYSALPPNTHLVWPGLLR